MGVQRPSYSPTSLPAPAKIALEFVYVAQFARQKGVLPSPMASMSDNGSSLSSGYRGIKLRNQPSDDKVRPSW